MNYSDDQLEAVFASNNGFCYHCGRALVLSGYGDRYSPWGWCIDHGNPLSRGGVHHGRNWRPSCYPCNEEKHDKTSGEYGRRRERPHYFD